jgi:hypothetical protein
MSLALRAHCSGCTNKGSCAPSATVPPCEECESYLGANHPLISCGSDGTLFDAELERKRGTACGPTARLFVKKGGAS